MYANCKPDDKKPCTPEFRWAQTKSEVWLVVLATCREDAREVVITESGFSFKCTSPEGLKFALDFQFREDVLTDEKKSFCKQEALSNYGGNVFEKCNLTKTDEHFFDQLLTSSDSSKYKKFHAIEWKMVSEKEWDFEEASKNVLIEYEDGGRVKAVTPEKLAKWKNAKKGKRKHILLDVQYPWCDKCNSQMDYFTKASRRLKKKMHFGYVDAREHRGLRKEFEKKKCDHTCEYKLLQMKGESWAVKKIAAKTNTQDLVKEIEDALAPVTKTIKTPKKLRKFLKKNEIVVAGYFAKGSKDKKKFLEVAKNLKKKIKFVTLKWTKSVDEPTNWAKAETGADKRALIYLRGRKRVFEGKWATFERWVNKHRIAPLMKYHFDLRTPAKESEAPIGILFLDVDSNKSEDPDELLIDKFLKLYDGFQELGTPVNILWADKSSDYMMADYGLDKKDKPAFVLGDSFDTDAKKYAFTKQSDGQVADPTDVKNIDEIRKFCERVLAGTEPRAYKSEKVPTEAYKRGKVQKIVGKTQHDILGNKEETFVVMLYKDHSTDKDKYKKEFEKWAKHFEHVDKVTFASFDTGKNYADWAFFGGVKKDSKVKFALVSMSQLTELQLAKGEAPKQTASEFPEVSKNGLKQEPVFRWLKTNSKYIARKWDAVQRSIEGKPPAKPEPEPKATPVRCVWGAWGACSASCGPGTMTRTKAVVERNGGKCAGNTSRYCNLRGCPPAADAVDCFWGAWSSCSATCGPGTQTRTKMEVEQNGGKCVGAPSKPCHVRPCAVGRDWTQTTFVGCFLDKGDRDLPLSKGTRTRQECAKQCAASGHRYFAQQYKGQCRCGHTYGKHGTSKDCNDCQRVNPPLSHNYGSWRNCIWRIGGWEKGDAAAPDDAPKEELRRRTIDEIPAETADKPDNFAMQQKREEQKKRREAAEKWKAEQDRQKAEAGVRDEL